MTAKKKSFTFRGLFLLLIPMIAFAVFGFYHRKEAIVRRIVQQELEKRFPEWNVRMDSARLVESKGVRLRDLKMSLPLRNGKETPLLEADEIFIQAPITFSSLFRKNVRPQRIVMTRPVFHLNDKNVDALRPFLHMEIDRSPDAPFCPLEIAGGSVALSISVGSANSAPLSYVIRGIDALLSPPGFESAAVPSAADSSAVDSSAAGNDSDSRLSAKTVPTTRPDEFWRLDGHCQNPLVKEIHFSGTATPDGQDWSLSGGVDSMEMEPRLLSPFVVDPTFMNLLESFQGRTSLSFSLRKDERSPLGFRYQLAGEIFRGSLVTSLLDHPVSDLFVRYRLDDGRLEIERLTARSGPVLILAQYLQNGFGMGKTFTLKAQMEEFPLNETLLKKFPSLPPQIRQWSNGASFSTTAKVNLTLQGDGKKVKPTGLALQCRNLAVGHESFPFRIEQLNGSLTMNDSGRVLYDFLSEKDHRKIRILGDYHVSLADCVGTTRFEATRIPIDEQLIDSLPEGCRDEIRALHPTGFLDAVATLRQTQSSDPPSETADRSDQNRVSPKIDIVLNVRDGTVRYDRFPFPISQISGKIVGSDGIWTFSDFRGSGASAEIAASGRLVPAAEGKGKEFALDVRLDRFPLGDEFRGALISPNQKELVEKLHLRGRSDADVRLRYFSAAKKFDLEFEAYPIAEETSIQPDHFPYELNGLEGVVVYREGNVSVSDLRGKNGPMTFSASVECRFSPNGETSVKVAPFTIDELLIDRRLQNAVPSQFLSFLDQINLAGYFNASGSVEFYRPSADAPSEAVWDTEIILHQNSADFGKEVSCVCGKTTLRGIADDQNLMMLHGELDIDSLCVGEVQVTRLTGPYYFDGRQFLFGKSVPALIELPLYQNEFLKRRLFAQNPYQTAASEIPEWNRVVSPRRDRSDGSLATETAMETMTETAAFPPLRPASDHSPIIRSQSTAKTDHPPRVASLAPTVNSVSGVPFGNIAPSVNPSGSAAASIGVVKEKKMAVNIAAPRPLSGELFHGQGTLNGTIRLTTPTTYQLEFNLQEGRFDEIIRDLTDQTQRLGGKVSAFVNLQGEGKNFGTLKGNGGLALRDAELYELPLMIQILQSLSVNEPDQTAFNSSFIDFQVFGNRLRLDRVLMEGDSLTLFGDGWLTIEGKDPKIDLTMNSRLGNVRNQIPLVSDVIGGAGDQIAQIKIEGPLSEASIRQDRFPGIKKAMWSIFPDRNKEKNKMSSSRNF